MKKKDKVDNKSLSFLKDNCLKSLTADAILIINKSVLSLKVYGEHRKNPLNFKLLWDGCNPAGPITVVSKPTGLPFGHYNLP